MMRSTKLLTLAAALVAAPLVVNATPASDNESYQNYFNTKFPQVSMQDYADGVYAIDHIKRTNWEAIEEFPPYETFIDEGQAMWEQKFANGKGYSDCFSGPGVAHEYPHWNKEKGMVMTLPLAVNDCRKANGEEPLKYGKGKIASLLAYMAYESRGNQTKVEIPSDDPRALEAYEAGKHFYFARRGQLNFSCASCHLQSAGNRIRTETLSPALGHTSHFPVYRSKWGAMGTLHRRFVGCNKQVRAKPFKPQSEEYRNLEYFLTHMSNGIVLNGPGARN